MSKRAAKLHDALRRIGPEVDYHNPLARFDGNTGKPVQNSEIAPGDSDAKLLRTAGISAQEYERQCGNGCAGNIIET